MDCARETSYGFNTNMYQMLLWLPALIALSLSVEFLLGPLFYKIYQKNVTLEEGAAGTEAGAEVSLAQSSTSIIQKNTRFYNKILLV